MPMCSLTKTPVPCSEAPFLDALRRRDALAYERLVAENRNRLIATALPIVGNREDALDVVQEAFLAAYRSIDRFRGGALISTWLHRITVNAALMLLRKRKSRHERVMEEEGQAELMATEDPAGADPEELLVAKQTLQQLDQRLRRLPQTNRSVFVLRQLEEHDTRRTAQKLGISTNAVKIRLHRARRELRKIA